jgi:hypothetical protein
MRGRAALSLAGLSLAALLAGCPTNFGISIQPPPPLPPEAPVPPAFEGDADPPLEPLAAEGLFVAPTVDRQLYYYEPDDLWYRYWRDSWYQAFRWNGAWFPPRSVPEPLRSRP